MGTTHLPTHLEVISPVAHLRPRPDVVWITQGDAAVLLDAESGLYFTLNGVAARTWELLAGGEPLSAILEQLEDEYDIGRQPLENDVAALLKHLVELGLLEESSS